MTSLINTLASVFVLTGCIGVVYAEADIVVTPIQYSRWLPADYHDQLTASLQELNPHATIVANRRTEILGEGHIYSLLAYRVDEVTTVQGAVVFRDRAWSYKHESAQPDLESIVHELSNLGD